MREFVAEHLFQIASWTDIRRAFERGTGRDLGRFFDQWVDGTEMPALDLENATATAVGGRYELRITLTQKPPLMSLTVPLAVYFEKGNRQDLLLPLTTEREEFSYSLAEKPMRVVLDENYDAFRHLTPAEVPPTIDTLLTRQHLTLLAPPGEEAKFRTFIDALEKQELPLALYGWIEESSRRAPRRLTRQASARLNGRRLGHL